MIQTNNLIALYADTRCMKNLRGLTDSRFGSEGEYCIAKCSHCGLLQTIPVPDAEKLKQLYKRHSIISVGKKEQLYQISGGAFLNSIVCRFWMAIDGDISFYLRRGKEVYWTLAAMRDEG